MIVSSIMILCSFMGLKGVLWVGSVADGLAFVFAFVLIFIEVKKIDCLEQKKGVEQ